MASSKPRATRTKTTRGFTLTVLAGPLCSLSPSITKQGSTFRIGRTKASKLQIKDETVSERHAELKWNGKKKVWEICDRGSSNGTSVNGVACAEGVWVVVESGDEVQIGETTVVRFAFFEEHAGKDDEAIQTEEGGDIAPAVLSRGSADVGPVAEDLSMKLEVQPAQKRVKKAEVGVKVKAKDGNDKENAEDNKDEPKEASTGKSEKDEARFDSMTTEASKKKTVLEYIEAQCAKLERELVEQGADAARRLREAWETEKLKILESLKS